MVILHSRSHTPVYLQTHTSLSPPFCPLAIAASDVIDYRSGILHEREAQWDLVWRRQGGRERERKKELEYGLFTFSTLPYRRTICFRIEARWAACFLSSRAPAGRGGDWLIRSAVTETILCKYLFSPSSVFRPFCFIFTAHVKRGVLFPSGHYATREWRS